MLHSINDLLEQIDDIVWGVPLIVLILGVGILLTVRTRGIQISHLGKALRFMVKNEEGGKGQITSFGALCTALSATIGTGNIVGVATALVVGGPGALFWMEIAAFFGMATKYSEGLLAIKYRVIKEDGHVLGGPFYYIQNGMGEKWKWLAKLFALLGTGAGLLGIGTITQINGITSAVNNYFDPNNIHTVTLFGLHYSWSVVISGILVTFFVALVLIGGLERIAGVSQIIVPVMAVFYLIAALIIVLTHLSDVPAVIVEVVTCAFGAKAVAGGAMGAMLVAMQKGIARGIFSNEAGLGSAPIAAAAAQTKSCVRQGLVSMTGTFIDTIVICTMTGLSILLTGSWNVGLKGVAVTSRAFAKGLPLPSSVSTGILMICLIFFAFTTILGWDYYSERCLEYLVGGKIKAVLTYRWIYILAVFIGPYLTVSAVWTIADILNGLMALPNLIAIIGLNGIIVAETKVFVKQHQERL